MNTTRTASGDPYRPSHLVTGPKASFADAVRDQGMPQRPTGVEIMGLEAIPGGVRRMHEPDHPHADADGFVTYPDIDHAAQMTLLIKTSRVYEANLTAMTIAQQMYARALELGK